MKTNALVRIVVWSIVIVILMGILVFFIPSCKSSAAPEFQVSIPEKASADPQSHSSSPDSIPDPPQPPATTPDASEASQPHTSSPGEASAQPDTAAPLEQSFLFNPEEVSELEIEWAAGNITICPADRSDIAVSETGTARANHAMVCTVRDHKLNIRFSDQRIFTGSGEKDLYVYIPRDWVCRSLEIEAASAHVELAQMTIREMDLDSASGTCNLAGCQIGDLDIETASGDVTFSGTLNTLDFDAASASFIGTLDNTPSRMEIDSMSGTLDIALPEDCGYSVNMEGLSRNFHSEFGDAYVYGDGRCRINVDGMNSAVTIRKADPAITKTKSVTIPEAWIFDPAITGTILVAGSIRENPSQEASIVGFANSGDLKEIFEIKSNQGIEWCRISEGWFPLADIQPER